MDDTELLQSVMNRVVEYLSSRKTRAVLPFQSPAALREQLSLELPEGAASREEIATSVEAILRHSVNTGSPRFLNLLYSGNSTPAVAGALLANSVNATMHTFESAPVATLMEEALLKRLCALVGFSEGEGVMTCGGSYANALGILCARHEVFPEAKEQGVEGLHLQGFVSDQAHYSYKRAFNLLGLGTKNLIAIPSDSEGRMIPDQLRHAVQASRAAGNIPFFVGATAGTTVTGAFDPLQSLAEVCERENLWLHIDGAWGAPVLFSEHHRALLDGCSRADSFTWDGHKVLGVPVLCSALLVRRRGYLRTLCGDGGDDYLFHDTDSPEYDLGARTLQCGREAHIFKIWLDWLAKGSDGYRERIERLFSLAEYATHALQERECFELLHSPQFLNLCFRYVPAGSTASLEEINDLQVKIRKQLLAEGDFWVNYADLRGCTVFRLVLPNPETEESDLQELFSRIERSAKIMTRSAVVLEERYRRDRP
ncbi:pyridoxal-dependent decarboxylase [bacterium]|nr:pyridoxal-dependent decarboxylase [bacterium]